MRVLITGATGLIGSHVAARLACLGHEVIGLAREPRGGIGVARWVVLDIASARSPSRWLPHLAGVEAVINCAGVLQDSARDDTEAVHAGSASALFEACELAGIRRVIHLSAIGVDREQPSRFSASKYAGDRQLMARDLDWVILRPSVVLGRPAFGASALIRSLASLPHLPLMPDTAPLQPVQLDDLLATVVFFLQPSAPSRVALELAGPERLSMAEVIAQYRSWYGWPKARAMTVPRGLAGLLYRLGDLAGGLGWRPPVRTNASKEIARGAVGDPQPWTELTGIFPQRLSQALSAQPAPIQEKWFARLYLLKAAIFAVLALFWIGTGIISLTAGYQNGVELMRSTGAGVLSGPAVIAGALADIIVGTLIAWRPLARWGLYGAMAVAIFYALAGTVLRPDLWSEPLGPLFKIVPIFVLHLVALAILDER